MSKRNLYAKRQLQSLQRQSGERNLSGSVILDFSRSRDDTEKLTGYPEFLSAIHEIAPDTPDWEWTEEQIQRASNKSGMCRKSIFTDNHEAHENITIQIHNRR